jgi:small subunit ribosomal protein S20
LCPFDSKSISAREFVLANTAQARKRIRQAEKHRQLNASMRSSMRTAFKKVVKALGTGDQAQSESAYKAAVPVLDRMARKGIIHKNKAARQKSRLNRQLKALQQQA